MTELAIAAMITLLKSLPQIIADAQESGELSDEKADAFRAEMQTAFESDAWKPDSNT